MTTDISRRNVLKGAAAAAAAGAAVVQATVANAAATPTSTGTPDGDLTTDVFIIGSGPIASTYARLLHADGRKVLMADSGPQMSRRPGEHLKNAVSFQRDLDRFTPIVSGLLEPISLPPRPGYSLTLDPMSFRTGINHAADRGALNPRQDPYTNMPSAGQGFAVGGMFIHWTSSTPRQHPVLERMQFIANDEWDHLYSCAEALVNSRTDAFEISLRQRVIRNRLQELYEGRLVAPYAPNNLPMAAERRTDDPEFVYYSGADAILGPLSLMPQDDTFRILPENRVKKLVVSGGRVVSAVVTDLIRGRDFNVSADTFIVAGGSVMSPQLLWASGIRPYALGRYLHEHMFTFTQVVLREDVIAEMAAAGGKGANANDPVPIPPHDPPPMLRVPVSENHPWHTQVHRDSFGFNQNVPADVDTRLILDLRSFGMVQPREDNMISFEEDLFDHFGMPQPTFHYTLAESDRKFGHDMMSDMLMQAQALGGFMTGSEPHFMPAGASLHVMGTTGMGTADDNKSVIDPYSKVWGFDNLLVGGNGVLSHANSCNPTLTAMAVAVRACEKLTGKKADPADLGMGALRDALGLPAQA